jgi:hypothetical protein
MQLARDMIVVLRWKDRHEKIVYKKVAAGLPFPQVETNYAQPQCSECAKSKNLAV